MKLKDSIKKFRVVNIIEDMKIINTVNTNKKSSFLSNLTFTSMYYIDIVAYYQPVTVSQVAELIGVSKSAVTIKIGELERKGYVVKVTDDKDRRKKNIQLSEAYQEILRNCSMKTDKLYAEMNGDFSDQEIELFTNMLDYLSDKRTTEE